MNPSPLRTAVSAVLLVFLTSGVILAQEGARERAQRFVDRGAWPEALEAADEALHEDPEDPVAIRLRAEALSGLGRWDDAVASFEEALGKSPPGLGLEEEAIRGLCRTLFWKARSQFDRGEPLAALDSINSALVWDVDFLEGILELCRILEAVGRKEDAWLEIKTALAKAPDNPEVLCHASRFFIRDHEFDNALPYLDRLLAGTAPRASKGTEAWASLTSGKIRLERGERGLAWKHLRRASELDPENEEAVQLFRSLEEVRKQAGRVARAERWLLLGSLAVLALWVLGGLAGWRALAKRGLL